MNPFREEFWNTQTYTASSAGFRLKVDETKLPQPGEIVRVRSTDGETRLCEVIAFNRLDDNGEWVARYRFTLALLPTGLHFTMEESSTFFELLPRATALEGLAEAGEE